MSSKVTRIGTDGCNKDAVSLSSKPEEHLLELTRFHENEVYKHRRRIAALSRTVNSVFSLPNELVVEIFLYYRDISIVPEVDSAGNHQQPFELAKWYWLVPTEICHRWRVVALACPLLWGYLDEDIFSRPPLLDATLHRSRSAPLDITIEYGLFAYDEMTSADTWNEEEKESWGKILNESYRIRTFRLDLPQSLIQLQGMNEAPLRPFALLVDLHINAFSYIKGGIPIPAVLNSMPRFLRILSLRGVFVSWEMLGNLPPTVTHLQIKFPVQNPPGTCEDLLNLLARLPNLERLLLKRIPIGTQGARRDSMVNLPHLKRLDLSQSHSWNIITVIQFLTFPPNIEATVRIKFNADNSVPPFPLSSVFTKFGLSSLPGDVKSDSINTEVTWNPSARYGLSFETSTETCIGSWPRYFHFTLYLCNERVFPDTSPWVEFIEAASVVVYPVLKSIFIETLYQVLSQATFSGSLLRANELESLQMNHMTAGLSLLDAIRVLPDGTVPMPMLRQIFVRHGSWAGYHINGDDLCDIVVERHKRGYGPEEFEMCSPISIDFNLPDTRRRLEEALILTLR
ncbi:hypothetical protein QCA50_005211 [Cerrena zonata]|uniref:F-box domain-containing protein n=1 Tax=Cerrena zonata TaxID=2478898 RepID=A0AAW0GE92_9APHY